MAACIWEHRPIIKCNCTDDDDDVDDDEDDDIYNRKLRLIAQSNYLLYNFECLDPVTKTKLFKSYCCCHNGCEL